MFFEQQSASFFNSANKPKWIEKYCTATMSDKVKIYHRILSVLWQLNKYRTEKKVIFVILVCCRSNKWILIYQCAVQIVSSRSSLLLLAFLFIVDVVGVIILSLNDEHGENSILNHFHCFKRRSIFVFWFRFFFKFIFHVTFRFFLCFTSNLSYSLWIEPETWFNWNGRHFDWLSSLRLLFFSFFIQQCRFASIVYYYICQQFRI